MGLESFNSEPESDSESEDTREEGECPHCKQEGEHLSGAEYRCTTEIDECEVLTWREVDFTIEDD